MDRVIRQEAIDWLLDCFGDEIDNAGYTRDDIREWSDTRIQRLVNRNYDGGWLAFAYNTSSLVS